MSTKTKWSKFGVSDGDDDKAIALSHVYRVCHLEDALRVFDDRMIRSSLVWDESCLNNTRTCVSWVSANTWAPGSLYGVIRFAFDWVRLANEKSFFWVEAMPHYNPPAYRILLSEREKVEGLLEYDFSTPPAPILYCVQGKTKKWFWNGRLTSEFLIDGDLSLDDCTKVDFVTHHGQYCRKSGSSCPAMNEQGREGGSRFLAHLLAEKKKRPDLRLFTEDDRLHTDAIIGWQLLRKRLKTDGGGTIRASDDAANDLIRAIFRLYATNELHSMRRLLALFKDSKQVYEAADRVAVRAFQLGDATRLDFEDS